MDKRELTWYLICGAACAGLLYAAKLMAFMSNFSL